MARIAPSYPEIVREATREATDARAVLPRLVGRITRIEWVVAGIVAAVLAILVAAEPDILDAPFASTRTVVVSVGGTLVAAIVLVAMLRLRVPPVARVLVLGIPFVAASWWLISPFFIDDVVDDEFVTSIAAARDATPTTMPARTPGATTPAAPTATSPPAKGPELLGAGTFVGLAGHSGTGDAGIFRLDDGSRVLRLESFDIQNGPDLELYLVPGADRRSPVDGSHHFGALRGNVGNQTYDLPDDFAVTPGPWTVLVWCRAFTVEFVAATVDVA